jgi:hypothetical protein
VELIVTELDSSAWLSREPVRSSETVGSPWLNGAVLEVDSPRLTSLFARLLRIAASQGGAAASLRRLTVDRRAALELTGSAIRQDTRAIEGLARVLGADPTALSSIACLAAIPLLAAARKGSARDAVRPARDATMIAWDAERSAADTAMRAADTAGTDGAEKAGLTATDDGSAVPQESGGRWCACCGAWPILGELRGLERARYLRCGRCANEWVAPWLQCPFCGERDHTRLGELIAEGGAEQRKVDTCATCKGYLKSVPSLTALSLGELLLVDAETLPLDVAALELGFERPAPAERIDVRLIERR